MTAKEQKINIQEVKQKVLNEGWAIENDVEDVEKLRRILKFIFPFDTCNTEGSFKYYVGTTDFWTYEKDSKNSIRLSSITFDEQPTVNDLIELRRKYPNNMEFGDEFDKLTNNLK